MRLRVMFRPILSMIRLVCRRARIRDNLLNYIRRSIFYFAIPEINRIRVKSAIDVQSHKGQDIPRFFEEFAQHLAIFIIVAGRVTTVIGLRDDDRASFIWENGHLGVKGRRTIFRIGIGVVDAPIAVHILENTERSNWISLVIRANQQGTQRHVHVVLRGHAERRVKLLRVLRSLSHIRRHDHVGEYGDGKHRHKSQDEK